MLKKLSVLFIISLVLLVGCKTKGGDINNLIIKEIDNKCAPNSTCQISISEITNFKWDKMVVFQVGSSNDEISEALGVDYKSSTDLLSGMVFAYNKKIVYEKRIPHNPEHSNKLEYIIEKKPHEPNCVSFTPDNAVLKGSKEEIDNVFYYKVTAVIK